MTFDEFRILAKSINALYGTNERKCIQDEFAANLWFKLLSDISYMDASKALENYMSINSFPPKPADIRKEVAKLSAPASAEISEGQAWAMVRKALNNGNYGAEEEFRALPAIVQVAVGNASNIREWAQTDIGSIESVIQSQFLRSYRDSLKRAKDAAVLNQGARLDNLIESTVDKLEAK